MADDLDISGDTTSDIGNEVSSDTGSGTGSDCSGDLAGDTATDLNGDAGDSTESGSDVVTDGTTGKDLNKYSKDYSYDDYLESGEVADTFVDNSGTELNEYNSGFTNEEIRNSLDGSASAYSANENEELKKLHKDETSALHNIMTAGAEGASSPSDLAQIGGAFSAPGTEGVLAQGLQAGWNMGVAGSEEYMDVAIRQHGESPAAALENIHIQQAIEEKPQGDDNGTV